jgi:ABC-type thiamine transport system ATPase subunit
LDKPLIQLSGGQKQRLSIARIFLNKKVPIVILDEAFSAMDSNLRKSMQKLVYNYIKRHGKTLIIVQHE